MYASQNAVITPNKGGSHPDDLDKSEKMKMSQMSLKMAKHAKSQID